MKVIVCGDVHFGAGNGLGKLEAGMHTRLADYQKSFDYCVDYAIHTKAAVFIQTGDLFETRNPTPEQILVADKAIKKLSDHGITTIIIMGNHDYKKNGSSYTSSILSLPSKNLPNVRLCIEPENIVLSENEEDINIFLVSYRDKKMYDGEQKEIVNNFNSHMRDLFEERQKTCDSIVVGHNFFFKGNYFDFAGGELLVFPETFKEASLVVMGHLHESSILKQSSPPCYYSGSLERTNFGEEGIDKTFIEFDTSTKEIKVLKNKAVRELLTLEFKLPEGLNGKDYISFIRDEIKDINLLKKIVRVKLQVPESIGNVINKNKIEKILLEEGAFFVSKIIVEIERHKIDRKVDLAGLSDNYKIFEAFAKTQITNSEFLEQVLTQAKEVM